MNFSRKRPLIILLIGTFVLIHADSGGYNQQYYPEYSLGANFLVSENAYSDNWSGDETGAISWVANLDGAIVWELNRNLYWQSNIKLSFGQTHSQNSDTKKWYKPAKSSDIVDFETTLIMTLGLFVSPYLGSRIQTQFLDFSTVDKTFVLNPAIFTESFGVAKSLYNSGGNYFTARLGAGSRQYYDRNAFDSSTGLRKSELTYDSGIEFVADSKFAIIPNKIAYSGKLTLFKALYYSEAEAFKDTPQSNYWKELDIQWDNNLAANITNNVIVNLYFKLLYDREIDAGTRFMQSLSLGIAYTL